MSAVIANRESHFQQTIDCLSTVIGDTPMLAVHYRYRGELRCIYAEAEYFNLTGSIKDRMVLHILRKSPRNTSTGLVPEALFENEFFAREAFVLPTLTRKYLLRTLRPSEIGGPNRRKPLSPDGNSIVEATIKSGPRFDLNEDGLLKPLFLDCTRPPSLKSPIEGAG
jgi:hypothetical protein